MMEKDKFSYIIESSKMKNQGIQMQNEGMFNKLLNKMYSKEETESEEEYALRIQKTRTFLEGVYIQITNKIEHRLQKPIELELYKEGFMTRDPYFLANYKGIMPMIKKMYFDKGVTAQMILHNYNPESTNEAITNESGGYMSEFLMVIREYAEEYNKRMFVKGIDKNMKAVRIKGIPMGVIKDIIANMRSYRARLKKENYRG